MTVVALLLLGEGGMETGMGGERWVGEGGRIVRDMVGGCVFS